VTAKQVNRTFDVVWQSHWTDAYLCCPAANHATRQPPARFPMLAVPVGEDLTHTEVRQRVTQAMPGTVKQLAARAGCTEKRVYAVISHWSRQGNLVTTKTAAGQRVIYALRTAA